LGGSTHASVLQGHSYTFEGAQPGLIVQALQKCGCMNPIIYFDELDKISETSQGQEIQNLLCHITDDSQNSEYQDKFLSNININLQNVTLVFSFNDVDKINPILKDRLKIIHTKGFSVEDKIKIGQNFLIPEICKNIGYENLEFSHDLINYIINQYTLKEDGVRNLKKKIEDIVSLCNLRNNIQDADLFKKLSGIDYNLFTDGINKNLIDLILKTKKQDDLISHLYM
ncbi:unnamed protein product, partial [marine sediment metagenome]